MNKPPYSRFYKSVIVCMFALLVCRIIDSFGIVINLTHSLPDKIFLVHLNKTPKVGDYILFKAPISSKLPSDTRLIKKILAEKGDMVTRIGQEFYINGKWVATAKPCSLQGEPLAVGPVGILEEGHFYVGTDHQDSFDSRYERMGWITKDLILGVAYAVW